MDQDVGSGPSRSEVDILSRLVGESNGSDGSGEGEEGVVQSNGPEGEEGVVGESNGSHWERVIIGEIDGSDWVDVDDDDDDEESDDGDLDNGGDCDSEDWSEPSLSFLLLTPLTTFSSLLM